MEKVIKAEGIRSMTSGNKKYITTVIPNAIKYYGRY
jgi:hypothetical protein